MKWPRHHVNAKRNFKRSHPRVKLTPVQVFSCKRLLRMLLQYGHSNQDAEIVRSQRFLKTKILMVFLQTDQEHLWFNYTTVENFKTVWTYRICSNNSRERLFEGGDYFKHCYYQIKQTEHGLLKCSRFGSFINFRSLNCHWSVLLHQIPLRLDGDWIKEWEDGERGWGGGGGGGIIRGTAISRGNTVSDLSGNSSKGYECYWSVCMHENLRTFSLQETLWGVPIWVSAL